MRLSARFDCAAGANNYSGSGGADCGRLTSAVPTSAFASCAAACLSTRATDGIAEALAKSKASCRATDPL